MPTLVLSSRDQGGDAARGGDAAYRGVADDEQHVDVARGAAREVLEAGLVVDDHPGVAVGDGVDDGAQHVVGGAVAAGPLGPAHGQQVDADALDDARVDLVVEQVALGDAGLEQVGARLLAGLLADVADGLLERQVEYRVEVAGRVGVDGQDGAGLALRQAADEQPGERGLAGAALAGDGDGGRHCCGPPFMWSPAGRPSRCRASRATAATLGKPAEVGVRQEERRRVLVHEAVVGAQLEVGHLGGHVEDVVAHAHAQQRRVGALGAGVAEELEALHRLVGQQADADGLLDVDVLAEGAADEDLLHVGEVDADAAAQHLEARVDRRLGADQAADVRLGEGDVVARRRLRRRGTRRTRARRRARACARVGASRSRCPDLSRRPVTKSSPSRSMRPLPQMPTAGASSTVRKVGSQVSSSM